MGVDTVSVRDLRNHGGEVLDKVSSMRSPMIVTKDGAPIAELHPVRPKGLSAEELIERRKQLPAMNAAELRRDIDRVLDMSL